MDLFRILLKRIFYKLPLKLLLIIVIALLCIIVLQKNSFCSEPPVYDYSYNDVNFSIRVTSNKIIYLARKSDGLPVLAYITNTPQDSFVRIKTDNNGNQFIYNYGSGIYTSAVSLQNGAYFTSGTWTGVNTAPYPINNDYFVLIAGVDVRDYDTGATLFNAYNFNPDYVSNLIPPFLTDDTNIPTWNFDYLIIHTGTVTPYYLDGNAYTRRTINLEVTNKETGIVYTIDCWNYLENVNNGYGLIAIPRNILTRFNVRNGLQVAFDLFVQPDDEPNSTGNWSTYSLGTYTLTLTTAEEEQINQDTQTNQFDEINSGISELNNNVNNLNTNINNVNNSVDNIQDSITDDSVDDMTDTFTDLSSGFEIQDPSGLEQVFQKLYNAFCTDEVISLTFTLPFVNKQVTISSANISANYPTALKSIVSVFVWGMCGLWVLKDIRSMVNKIAEGNPEDTGSDIKKEVL